MSKTERSPYRSSEKTKNIKKNKKGNRKSKNQSLRNVSLIEDYDSLDEMFIDQLGLNED